MSSSYNYETRLICKYSVEMIITSSFIVISQTIIPSIKD